MARVGKHFTLEELTVSQVAARQGLDNTPDTPAIGDLHDLVRYVLDPLREALGAPVLVNSGYRSEAVNKAVGGVRTSQHCLGQAADIHVNGMSVAELVRTVVDLHLPYDQLIDEYGYWVHVSYGPRHRREVLIARKVDSKTVYTPFR